MKKPKETWGPDQTRKAKEYITYLEEQATIGREVGDVKFAATMALYNMILRVDKAPAGPAKDAWAKDLNQFNNCLSFIDYLFTENNKLNQYNQYNVNLVDKLTEENNHLKETLSNITDNF